MKRLFLASLGAAMLFGMGAAFAQGLPPGTVPPVYGSMTSSADRQAMQNRDMRMPEVRQPDVGQMPDARTVEKGVKPTTSKIDG